MKIYHYRISVFLCCLFISSSTLFSQEIDTNDFELWSSVGVAYSLNDNFKVGLKEHLRLKENALKNLLLYVAQKTPQMLSLLFR